MIQRLPLVVILGPTGSGKTKLSIELAHKFQGEIVSADSMQVYKGLDIITAKANKEEQSLVPHHMIDILEPHETFTVLDFRNRSLKIIDNLINANKLPIVVGGTNYYIESLLWKILIAAPGEQPAKPDVANKDHELSAAELHRKLQALDPDMARRLHPNNKRKIIRALEVLYSKGRQLSKILEEQQKTKGASMSGGGLRYSNALVFRLQCQQDVLDVRLKNRVDKMLQDGLLDELQSFHRKHRDNCTETPDFTKGVFQSIGFKEFHSFLVMSNEERGSERGQKEFKKCVEELNLVTRRFARTQNKWTKNRFLGRRDREVPAIYGLDTTDEAKWSESVTQPAVHVIESAICQTECKYQPLPMQSVASTANSEDDSHFCDICERVFVGTFQWKEHLRSNKHKKMRERKNRISKT